MFKTVLNLVVHSSHMRSTHDVFEKESRFSPLRASQNAAMLMFFRPRRLCVGKGGETRCSTYNSVTTSSWSVSTDEGTGVHELISDSNTFVLARHSYHKAPAVCLCC